MYINRNKYFIVFTYIRQRVFRRNISAEHRERKKTKSCGVDRGPSLCTVCNVTRYYNARKTSTQARQYTTTELWKRIEKGRRTFYRLSVRILERSTAASGLSTGRTNAYSLTVRRTQPPKELRVFPRPARTDRTVGPCIQCGHDKVVLLLIAFCARPHCSRCGTPTDNRTGKPADGTTVLFSLSIINVFFFSWLWDKCNITNSILQYHKGIYIRFNLCNLLRLNGSR